MNPKTEELLNRTFEFGVKCLLFLESLPKTKANAVITYQLAKSATSQLDLIMKKLRQQNPQGILYIRLV